ncbi:unnamed protein product [Orchesella dallaii]
MALMALCFILGTILIIKSYIMTRLRTNIMTEMRRRRRTGPAPSNTYVGTNEMTTPRFQDSDNNDRRSAIPSVSSLATQGRAWQRQSELTEWVAFGITVKGATVAEFLQSVYFLVAYAAMYYAQQSLINKRHQVSELFNNALTFEKKYNAKNWKPIGNSGRFAKAFILLAVLPAPIQIFGNVLQAILSPCIPSRFGYIMHSTCFHWGSQLTPFLSSFFKIFSPTVMLLLSWYTAAFWGPGCIIEIVLSFTFSHCITNYTKMISRLLDLNFPPKRKESDRIIKLIRQTHLLTIQFNSFHQNYNALVKLIQVGTMLITMLFAIIRLHTVLPTFRLIVLFILTVQMITVVVFVYGTMADVNVKSKELIMKLTACDVFRTNRLMSREIKSFAPLKVYLGSVNYVEKLTPLNTMSFVINQLVGVLLW